MAEGQAAGNLITVTVKTPKNKETITIDENADIKDVSRPSHQNGSETL